MVRLMYSDARYADMIMCWMCRNSEKMSLLLNDCDKGVEANNFTGKHAEIREVFIIDSLPTKRSCKEITVRNVFVVCCSEDLRHEVMIPSGMIPSRTCHQSARNFTCKQDFNTHESIANTTSTYTSSAATFGW